MAVKRLFQALPDETKPTTGAEIGAALAPALEKLAEAGERQAATFSEMLAKAMAEVMHHQKQSSEAHSAPRQVLHWEFDVIRDERGRMERVIARAGTAH